MKALYLTVAAALAVLLLYSVNLLPARGDLAAPAQQEVSAAGTPGVGTYYIRNAYPQAATPNMVTVVLADYRSFDTLGEAFVVFTGGVACWLLLRGRRP
ncbi:MAG: hydrogen gas-evolving membrane-bound hydrogenase subunit E [Deferrisomatales bacterium]|nr:hydrogen gas-evolving membrane-bound hydrogenase subunit E [Deferrisomatales bacterium]